MKFTNTIKGIESREMWAAFFPDGEILYGTIAETRDKCKELLLHRYWGNSKVFRFNKIKIDIQLL